LKRCLPYLLVLFFSVLCLPLWAQYDTVAADTTKVDETVAVDEESGEEITDEELPATPDSLKWELRSISRDSVLSFTNDKGFYYKNYLDSLLRASQAKPIIKQKSKEPRIISRNLFDSVFGVIFWMLAIGLFGFLVYKLFLSNSSLFSRSRKNIAADINIEEAVVNGDPDTQLRNAIKSGNHRLAVRLLYLQTLGRLAERKLITISSNKTNYEYVNEVRKQIFANAFASLTLKYEYVWYGEYPVDVNLFKQLEEEFNYFNKTVLK